MSSFLTGIDAKWLAARAASRSRAAFREFEKGLLLSEEPYMSHLFNKIGRKCRRKTAGAAGLLVTQTLAVLHRKERRSGKKRLSDKYGADLQLQVTRAGSPPAMKIAFFQFKMTDEDTVTLDLDQLYELANDPIAKDRGYVVAVLNHCQGNCLVASSVALWKTVDKAQQNVVVARAAARSKATKKAGKKKVSTKRAPTAEFDITSWIQASAWVESWLKCDTGPLSSTDDLAVLKLIGEGVQTSNTAAAASDLHAISYGDFQVAAAMELRVDSTDR